MGKKSDFTTEIARCRLMVASWACEVTEILTQSSPTSNHIQDIDIAVSFVYDTV